MRVAVRVDASRAIGTGHVRRMVALARGLESCGADVRFVWRDLGIDVAAMLPLAEWALPALPAPSGDFIADAGAPDHAHWAGVSAKQDAAETLAAIRDFAPDWVVVDHYGFAADWHEAMRDGCGARIAVIDDLADRALAADVVVDHNHHADHRAKYAEVLATPAWVLGGPRFALLGSAFAEAERLVVADNVASIGVFMGGVDADGMSVAVLDAIDAAGFAAPVEVVTTSANPGLEALRARVAARPGASLTVDLPDLAAFFARHQLQVGAGGGATWERCCIGAPTILLSVAENQQAVIPALVERGVVLGAQPGEALVAAIRQALGDADLRRRMADAARALVDGRGALRVALAMARDTMTVRDATMDDARLMLDWRNDPATRAVSRGSAEIDWDGHLAWVARKLADPDCRLMIGKIGAVPVGVIRFDRDAASGDCEVSLYLDPDLQGLKLGPAMLAAAEALAFPDSDIHAEVLAGNVGSERLFLGGGYAAISAATADTPAHFLKRRRVAAGVTS